MKPKALLLLSGGLDSTISAKLMLEMGIELYAFHMTTFFCTCTRKGKSCNQAIQTAKELGIPIKIIAPKDEYLKIVEKPKYGWGKGANPCIDCRIFLFREAKKYAEKVGASFFVTGEVLGQRPKSQYLACLQKIEEDAGLKGLVVRPLSGKLLPASKAEMEGWISRDKMLAISGRSRKLQIEIAEKYGINDFPCPAGGCLLTDPQFSRKVKDAIKYGELNITNIPLLKIGRHFRLPDGEKLIVGRNENENKKLILYRDSFVVLEAVNYKSPVALLGFYRGKLACPKGNPTNNYQLPAGIVLRYSDCPFKKGKVKIIENGKEIVIESTSLPQNEIDKWRI